MFLKGIERTGKTSICSCMGEHPSAQNGGYVPIRHWANRYQVCASNIISSCHVETVVLLSKGNISSEKIRVEFDLEDMDMSGFRQGATYEEIQEWVQEKYGFHVTHLNIAQVKRKHGIIERENYNKPKSLDSRQPGCPEEKVKAIEAALKHFRMI